MAIFIFKENFKYNPKIFEAILIGEGVLIPIIGTILLVAIFTNKISVFNDGISSYDPYRNGQHDFMNWSNMHSIRIRSVFGYKYYFIQSEDLREQLWIPNKIKHKDKFIELIRSLTDSNHVLTSELLRFEA